MPVVFSTGLCHPRRRRAARCEGRNLFFDWNKIPRQVRNDKGKDENIPLHMPAIETNP